MPSRRQKKAKILAALEAGTPADGLAEATGLTQLRVDRVVAWMGGLPDQKPARKPARKKPAAKKRSRKTAK